MLEAIREMTDRAYKEYDSSDRAKWVVNRCGMAVLNMDMTFWTCETEKYLKE